jgi:potassium-transporting ATPase ATP-binding subunit
VLFANFAEAMAEGRGKAQAATLRATRQRPPARRRPSIRREPRGRCPRPTCEIGDECVVSAGEVIPGDGDVVEGIATSTSRPSPASRRR